MTDGFVILAEFRLEPGKRDRFLEVVRADAEASVRDEPGCQRFDILTSAEEPDTVWLHEVYDSAQAFEAHLGTSHFGRFDRDSKPLVAASNVRKLERIGHART